MIRQNIFEKQKRQTPKMTFVYILKVADRLPFVLENADKGLHTKTSEDDGNPADGSEDNGFSAGSYHGYQIGFEADSTHGYDNEEFGELFERGKETTRHTKRGEQCGKERGEDEVKDKKWKDFFKLQTLLIFLLTTLPVGEKESDGDDSQGPRKFDNGCGFESITLVKAVPGASCGGYRGSIIDRSSCKDGEAFIGQMKPGAQGWKDERSQDIEEKDNRDGLGYFLFLGMDNGRCRSNGRAPTDRRTYSNQGSQFCVQCKEVLEKVGNNQGY